MTWTHGYFHWNELMTRDVETARTFYAQTLGWTFDAVPMPDGEVYQVAMGEAGPIAGLFEMAGDEFDGVPEHWFGYIAVDDVDARVAKAVELGAKIVKPAFDVAGVGRFVILEQPGGGVVGWMTPSPGEGC